MAWSLTELTNALVIAMVDNSRYPVLAGEPMPSGMRGEMEDSMARLADPIYQFLESYVLDPSLQASYQVKTHVDDPLAGYLGAKIDGDTIKYDEGTFKLYVNAIPLASSVKTGGVRIGAQPFLFLQGYDLMLNAETDPLLLGGNDMVPTSRAVKLYVDGIIVAGGTGGDMYKSTYDTGDNGVVDDSERLGNQLPAYYLAWANFTGTPTTIAGYGITNAYTQTEIDAFFEGEDAGKKQVDWTRIISKPAIVSIPDPVNDRVLTSDGTATGIVTEASLTFTGTSLTIDGYVYPGTDTSWNLGSVSARWTRLYTNYVHFVDTSTYIWRDASNNLYFSDINTGSVTLADLVAGPIDISGTPANNQVVIWVNSNTLEGDAGLTWSGTILDTTGTLLVDAIDEHTGAAGVTIESIKIEDGTFYTTITDMTFQDGTTGPHTLSDLISSGSTTFIGLTDTPTDWTGGVAGYLVMVDATPDAIEFIDPSGYAINNFSGTLTGNWTVTGSDSHKWRVQSVHAATGSVYAEFSNGGKSFNAVSWGNDDYTGNYGEIYIDDAVVHLKLDNSVNSKIIAITVSAMTVTDTISSIGFQYAADYKTNGMSLGDRWIPDKGYVDDYFNAQPITFTSLAADDIVKWSGSAWINTPMPTGGGMTYPGAGIALSTGSAWDTSITNNSGNWNTAYGWGDHAGLYAASSHAHGNITNAGAIGSTTNLPIITTTSGVLIASSFGSGAYTFCVGNDSRLSNARTPTAHAMDSTSYHTSSDVTTLNATTVKHGFLKKLSNTATEYMNGAGNWTVPAGSGISWTGSTTNAVGTYGGISSIIAETNLRFDAASYQLWIEHDIHGYEGLLVEVDGAVVESNTTNSDRAITVDLRLAYAINTSITDSGYRMGQNIISAVNDARFLGNLDEQFGIRIQYGSLSGSGAGTITDTYALYLEHNSAGSATLTNIYSIYSTGAAMMYHAGNVGIGVAPSSSFSLYVGGAGTANSWEQQITALDTRTTYAIGTGGGIAFYGYDTSSTIAVGAYIKAYKQSATSGNDSYNLSFGARTNASDPNEQMRLYYNGLAVQTLMTIGSITLHNAGTYNASLYINTSRELPGYAAYFHNTTGTSTTNGIAIQCGTSTEDAIFINFYDNDTTYCGKIYSTTSADISLVGSSDKRLKTAFRSTKVDPIRILSMPIEDFKMKSHLRTSKEKFITGYVAQHINEFYPEMVLYDKEEDIYMVDKMKLIPILHRGWQLHEERLNKLESDQDKIIRLEKRVTELEDRLNVA